MVGVAGLCLALGFTRGALVLGLKLHLIWSSPAKRSLCAVGLGGGGKDQRLSFLLSSLPSHLLILKGAAIAYYLLFLALLKKVW